MSSVAVEKPCCGGKERREYNRNQRLTYTQQKACTYTNFLVSKTSYKVLVDILFYYPSHVSSVCTLILLGMVSCLPQILKGVLLPERVLALNNYFYLPIPAPDPSSRGQLPKDTDRTAFPTPHQSGLEIPERSIFWLRVTFICTKNKNILHFHYILTPYLWI